MLRIIFKSKDLVDAINLKISLEESVKSRLLMRNSPFLLVLKDKKRLPVVGFISVTRNEVSANGLFLTDAIPLSVMPNSGKYLISSYLSFSTCSHVKRRQPCVIIKLSKARRAAAVVSSK